MRELAPVRVCVCACAKASDAQSLLLPERPGRVAAEATGFTLKAPVKAFTVWRRRRRTKKKKLVPLCASDRGCLSLQESWAGEFERGGEREK